MHNNTFEVLTPTLLTREVKLVNCTSNFMENGEK